jgi:hypothetical protein
MCIENEHIYDGFEHLARSLALGRDSLMAMFTAYFDESGTHADSRVVCMAGYVSTVVAWEQLGTEWKRMCDEEGIKVLHRVDLENFKKEFKGWDETRRRNILREANRLTRRYTQKGVFGAVVRKDFDQVMPGCVRRAFGGSYGWLVQEGMVGIGHWGMDRHRSDPINYVFEAGANGRHQVERMFNALYDAEDRTWRDKLLLGSWSFAEKQYVIQLQPADVLAYETYKHMLNRVVDGVKRDIRKSVRHLIRPTDEGHYWDADRLLSWIVRSQSLIEKLNERERVLKAAGLAHLI